MLAAQQAAAEEPQSVVIGQSLIGATHSHQNGLTHNHGPLSVSPTGPAHFHTITGVAGGYPAMTGALLPQTQPAQAAPLVVVPYNAGAKAALASSQGFGTLGTAGTPFTPFMSYAPNAPYAPFTALRAAPAQGDMDLGPALGLGLAGLTALAAMVIWGEDDPALGQAASSGSSTPYLASGTGSSSGSGASSSDSGALRLTSASTFSVTEGETGSFAVITATDPEDDSLTFSIIGGTDQLDFKINPVTGVLSYDDPSAPKKGDAKHSEPDFSALTKDADGTEPRNDTNSLDVQVQVTNSQGQTDSQNLTFLIQNDPRDDQVSSYKEADDLARLTEAGTNSLGALDAAALGQDSNGQSLLISIDGDDAVRVTTLSGDGSASSGTSFGTSGAVYRDLALGDIDGDGNLDLALAGQDSGGKNRLEVWESNGLGSFSLKYTATEASTSTTLDDAGTLRGVVMGDFDGTGYLDLFVVNDGGEESLITLTGQYSGTVESLDDLDADTALAVIDEDDLSVSTDYLVALENGDISLIDAKDGEQADQQAGSYQALAVHEDLVFAAEDDRVDVYEADSNSLDLETTNLISGADTIVDLLLGDFDSGYDEADLLYSIDIDDDASTLLTIPEALESLSASGGNLADDILVGGSSSTVFYDETSL